jgi:Uma2 family endonuclease
MAVQQRSYTVEEFLAIAKSEEYESSRLELLDGELLVMPPSSPLNSQIAILIAYFLTAYVLANKLGRVTGADGGYRLAPKTTLVPDVAYTSYKRQLDFSGSVVNGAPDLAVEVISPSESAQDVQDKVWAFLQAGTRLVWVVYPKTKLVDVCHLASDNQLVASRLGIDGVLEGTDILPGFTLPVKDIFPEEAE